MPDAAPEKPNLMTRLTSAMRGEVAAGTVEAFRRAGMVVYDDLANAEQVRRDIVVSGTDLWVHHPGTVKSAARHLERLRVADPRRRAHRG